MINIDIIQWELLIIIVLLFVLCMLQSNGVKKKIHSLYTTIKIFINRAFHLIPFYLARLLPRDNNLVLFGADNGNVFSGNPKYLFKAIQGYPEIKSAWIAKNEKVCESIRAQGYDAYMSNSAKGLWLQLRAKTLIHSHSIKEDFNYMAVSGATSINCWHGVGLKRSWWRNKNSFAGKWMNATPSFKRNYHLLWARTNMAKNNYVVATSEEVAEYYPATYNVAPENIINLGQARNDVFFDESLEDSSIPDIFKETKTIVYMPTHRDYGRKKGKNEKDIGRNIDYEALNEVLKRYGYTFIIKQHRWNTGMHSLTRSYSNIIDISDDNYSLDTQLLLKYTDILITDYSSCYTDFLLLNRPVVFYCYDLQEYLDKWELNFDYDYVTPGPKVFNSDELLNSLEKLMQGKDDFVDERERVKRVFYSPENQGPVTNKQVDYFIKNIIRRK